MPELACDSVDQLKNFVVDTELSPLVVCFTQFPKLEHQLVDILKVLSSDPSCMTINFLHADIEKLGPVQKEFNVDVAPAVLIFYKGKEVDRMFPSDFEQMTVPNFVKRIKSFNSNTKTDATGPTDLNTRLHKLINQAPVMLFMKGNPATPRCGFSRKMVDLLNAVQMSFDSFDILTDDEVRQGLKTYSKWPTYPQLYIKGELVGGLDIVTELAQSGELKTML